MKQLKKLVEKPAPTENGLENGDVIDDGGPEWQVSPRNRFEFCLSVFF